MLKENRIAGAGLDVFERAIDTDHPLLHMDNVIVSPFSSATKEATLYGDGSCGGGR